MNCLRVYKKSSIDAERVETHMMESEKHLQESIRLAVCWNAAFVEVIYPDAVGIPELNTIR